MVQYDKIKNISMLFLSGDQLYKTLLFEFLLNKKSCLTAAFFIAGYFTPILNI